MARWLPGGRLPSAGGPLGLAVQAGGLAVRAWSMRALGASYTRTLRTGEDEPSLIDRGPYRSVRHPGYLGSLLIWIGFALTSRSVPVVALTSGLLGAVYIRRISAEEQLLHRTLPGYTAYSRRTRRLIPLVW
jgi:protein-S-isoprenylcysteine O-methyltransferase Ste14